jgi:hypothetical protein
MNKNYLCIIFDVCNQIIEVRTHFTNLKKSTKNRNGTDQNSNTIKTNNF